MDFQSCQQLIACKINTLGSERVSLEAALARVTASLHKAIVPQPEFRQSLRDGYVIGDYGQHVGETVFFPVSGMIPAGRIAPPSLEPEKASRIMTGGMVPKGGTRVLPQEDCVETSRGIEVPLAALKRRNTFIQEQGSEIAAGAEVVQAGTVLLPDHISTLAAVGCEDIEVYNRPRVGYLCTGSELVDTPQELHPGLKVSSNRYLLDGLIRQFGAVPAYLGTVHDSADKLAAIIDKLSYDRYDLVISTGGMGPGKYDLIEQAFINTGGDVLYNGLDLRPGKATLCGTLARTLFFGLPGPPTAVRALMNCIVGPALLQMQGIVKHYPITIQAHLTHDFAVKRPGVMQLKGGILSFNNGRCEVKEASKLMPPCCYLIIPADRASFEKGEPIAVQLTLAPFSSTVGEP
ncbi:molybdopterin molybdotransferase MoeA [Desulfosediminicola ganghwensis]|uniref:molybdopterin molybdotransferase MoeA n=1 Tax=Desulfosediminicola ganghwensis TaxID=2569540 RepID=UPI0010ACDE5F|nr:molybdopterin molybdotransferase MoeA [Desulfosediminicola ganghwensis]